MSTKCDVMYENVEDDDFVSYYFVFIKAVLNLVKPFLFYFSMVFRNPGTDLLCGNTGPILSCMFFLNLLYPL